MQRYGKNLKHQIFLKFFKSLAEGFRRGLDLHRGIELLEKAHVVLEVVAQVVDAPLEHRNALQAHSEGEAGVLLRIYAAGLENVGVHHTAAEDLKPACALADVAALAVADVAADVNLGGRLGEREVRRAHADLGLGTEHLAGEEEDSLLEVGEGHALVDVEALDLVEYAVRAGADRLVAEHAAGADDADGEFHRLHRTDLHRRGVRAEKQGVGMTCGNKESVLHVAGGVVLREVQSLEHVVVVLDLGAFGHVIAELAENVHDLLADDGDGVARAELERVAGHRQVVLGAVGGTLVDHGAPELLDLGHGGVLEVVERTAELLLRLLVQGAELVEKFRHLSLLSEEAHAGLLHFLLRPALEIRDLGKDFQNLISHI